MKLRCMDGMRQGKVRLSRDYEIKLSAHSSTLHLADVPGVPAGVYLPIDSGNRHHFPADVVLMDTQLARAIFQSSSSAATTSIPTGKQHYLPHELDALIIEEDRLPEIRQLNCEPLTAQDWQSDNADWVERSMLAQVQYASVGQIIVLWVHHTALIRLRVTAIELLLPHAYSGVDALCGRLSSMSELAIAPPTAAIQKDCVVSRSLQVWIGGASDSDGLHLPVIYLPVSMIQSSAVCVARINPRFQCSSSHGSGKYHCPPPSGMFAAVSRQSASATPQIASCVAHSLHYPPAGAYYSITIQPMQTAATATGHLEWIIRPVDTAFTASGDIETVESFRASLRCALNNNPGRVPVVITNGMLWPLASADRQWVCVQFSDDGGGPFAVLNSVSDIPSNIQLGQSIICPDLLSTRHENDDDHTTSTEYTATVKQIMDYTIETGLPQRLIISGPAASGKSFILDRLVKQLLRESKIYVQSISCDRMARRIVKRQDMIEYLTECVERAMHNSPAALLLDDFDYLQLSSAEEFMQTVLEGPLLIIVTVSSTAYTSILEHQFCHQIQLPGAPDRSTRERLLREMLLNADADCQLLASMTEGMTVGSLKRLTEYTAAQQPPSTRSLIDTLESKDFLDSCTDNLQNISQNHNNCSNTIVQWKDIGGMAAVKNALCESLLWPTRYSAIFQQIPLKPRGGLLLYGPPGCGKTMIANSLANEFRLRLITVKGPELFNKYIGASEQAVRDAFDRAATSKPCILFFDEFDSVAPRRGSDETGVTDRVVNQLLTQLDGADQLTDGVFVLAASSRPHLIDPALLRPGRLSKRIYCRLPELDERIEILRIYGKRVGINDDDWQVSFGEKTRGWTGADLKALTTGAYLEALHERIDNDPELLTDRPVVQRYHLERALVNFRPSLQPQESARLQNIYQQFSSDEEGGYISSDKIGILSTQHA